MMNTMSWKPQTMATDPAQAWMTTLRTPLRETLLSLLPDEPAWRAASAFERDYVQRVGYRLGPQGEWIAAQLN
jgi:hypothetical protein